MTSNNRTSTKLNLRVLLNKALIKKFGKIPSASKFADQFNLRAFGTTTVTRETSRKWIAGLAVPEIDKLCILVSWLELDPAEIFQTHIPHTSSFYNGSSVSKTPSEEAVIIKNGLGHSLNSDQHHDQALMFQENLIKYINEMTDESKKALFIAAWMLKQLENNHASLIDCDALIKQELLGGEH
jgi:hypothetical protein